MKAPKLFFTATACLILLPLGLAPEVTRAESENDRSFRQVVLPFLNENCVFCHNGTLETVGLRLDVFQESGQGPEGSGLWQKVQEKLLLGEMPPKDRPQPSPDSVAAVIEWIKTRTEDPALVGPPEPGRVTARRLNRSEYDNTIRDLIGVNLKLADDFPADDAGYGFDNNGDVLSLPPILMEKYLSAAERIAEAAIVTQPWADATLVKYLASRVEGEENFFPDGAYRVSHSFPLAGEYDLQLRVIDRRYRPKKDEPPPPMPASGILAVFLDGRQLKTFEVEPDKYDRGTFDVTLEVTAGEHELFAELLSDGMEGIPEPKDSTDSYKGERKLFVDDFVVLGPLKVKPLPLTKSHRRILICGDPAAGYQPECARQILSRLLRRAYRHPVRSEEIESLLQFVELAVGEGDSFAHGIRLALKVILVSPHFLFRIERDPDSGDPDLPHQINQHELAVRLSYFLWSSMPDEELFQGAERSELSEPQQLEKQIRRMLADPKSAALVENFGGQWLQLRNLESITPDPDRFPDFDDELREAMRRETELFFKAVVDEDLSVVAFLDAEFTFLNQRLARHYGIEGVEGDLFRRVRLDPAQRSGILTQASVLTVSSYPTRTSPVLRGKWLLDNILGAPPPAPPPGIPALNEEKVGLDGTLREQLEQHRSNPACAVCHIKMDALGFGLENYDAVGAWRTRDGRFPIDSAGTLPGGEAFSGPAQLRAILVDDKREFGRCLTEKMLTYALGRGLESYDTPTVEKIVQRLEQDQYRFSRLVLEIVTSMPFRMRRGETER